MAWGCMALSGTGPLNFTDDLMYDDSSRMNLEGYKTILPTNIQENGTRFVGKCFILHQDNDPKHPASSVKELFWAAMWAFNCKTGLALHWKKCFYWGHYVKRSDVWHFSNIGIGRYVFLFGWCVRGGTFILTALRTAPEHTALTFSLLFAVIIQSNSDISLSNNQIEMLNNGIKMYAKKVL